MRVRISADTVLLDHISTCSELVHCVDAHWKHTQSAVILLSAGAQCNLKPDCLPGYRIEAMMGLKAKVHHLFICKELSPFQAPLLGGAHDEHPYSCRHTEYWLCSGVGTVQKRIYLPVEMVHHGGSAVTKPAIFIGEEPVVHVWPWPRPSWPGRLMKCFQWRLQQRTS